MRPARIVGVLCLAAPIAAEVRAADDDGVPIAGDDFVVTGRVKIKPGTYRVADKNGDGVIHVTGDGTSLDLTGVTLIGAADDALPDTFAGVGVSVDGAKDVVVKGGAVRGFKIGIRAHDCPGVKLTSIDASGNFKQHLRSTVEREDASDWLYGHENDDGHWERDYGAGIALKNCPKATVAVCRVRAGQNGVLLDRCDGAIVIASDFSFNSGWGIALWRTCDAGVAGNRADWCVRGYSHGRYARGQDSAGIFVFEQCSRNSFNGNSVTHGGDGFFLYAGNETLNETGLGGCNDNVVHRNDFSHAVANGIEATFSRGNRFEENLIQDCEHGVWAGYSWDTVVEDNDVADCTNGVSIEHGRDNRIVLNRIHSCRVGVHLWWDPDEELAKTTFGVMHRFERDGLRSRGSAIDGNRFSANATDVLLEDDQNSTVVRNDFIEDAHVVRKGDTTGTIIDLETKPAVDPPFIGCRLRVPVPRLPKDALRGRKYILVDDWGPIPPSETRLFPATVDAVGAAKLSALGVDKTFTVTSLTDGFVAEPTTGAMPATIVVRRKDEGAAPKAFDIVVKCGAEVRAARGTVSSMPWDVRFFQWTADPRTDADAWKTLLAGPPVETRRVDGLDFERHGEAVDDKVGRDHWGTLATCDVETAAGKWRLATVSDDGIRVWVDGKLVVDDWTHHGPTPHDVDLSAGKHAIRVEHFQIDGWAALRVTLAPVAK